MKESAKGFALIAIGLFIAQASIIVILEEMYERVIEVSIAVVRGGLYHPYLLDWAYLPLSFMLISSLLISKGIIEVIEVERGKDETRAAK